MCAIDLSMAKVWTRQIIIHPVQTLKKGGSPTRVPRRWGCARDETQVQNLVSRPNRPFSLTVVATLDS